MTISQLSLSPEASLILSQYPQWQLMVIEAINKPLLDINYCPSVVETFDQFGLLAGRIHNSFSYECTRDTRCKSDFIAWLFDGDLAVFYVNSEVIVNRLNRQCLEGLFYG
ncbi:MAG: hypothetical protein HC908_08085 [Calothrix sp. SM1_7_51]|nr:hypothetical protein [Calothrix sp. SM1_7_51]